MLTTLLAKNFQKHQHLELAFDPGLTLICGQNWAGKTTVMRAISYALYGPSGIPGGLRAARTHGLNTSPHVELGFKLGNDPYLIRRSGGVTRLLKNGTMIANGTGPVNDAVKDLLGMEPGLYALIKTAPQERAGAILSLGSEKLGKIVDQITGVDVADRVGELAKDERLIAMAQASAMNLPDISKLQDSVSDLYKQLWETHGKLVKQEEIVKQGTQAVEKAQKQSEIFSTRWQQKMQKAQSLQRDEGVLADLKGELGRLLQLSAPDSLQEVERQVSELQALYDEHVSRGTYAAGLEQRLNYHETERDKASAELKKVEAQLNGYATDNELSALKQACDEALRKASAAEHQVATAKAALNNAVCPTCHRPLEGVNEQTLQQQLAAHTRQCAIATTAHEDAREKLETATAARKARDQYEALLERVKLLVEEIDSLKLEHAQLKLSNDVEFTQLEDQLFDYKEELDRRRQQWARYEMAIERKAIVENRVTELEKTCRAAKEQEDPISREEVQQAYETAQKIQRKASKEEQTFTNLRFEYQSKYSRYQEIENQLKAAKEAENKRTALIGRANVCQQLRKYLTTNRDRFSKEVWEALLVSASSFAQLATSGQISKVLRTQDGEFRYQENGHEMPIEAASGVQQAILGVGVRTAIGEALQSPVRWLLLDEVTAGATSDVSLAITRTLRHAAEQVIMVTHRQADAAAADAVITL